MALSSAEQYLLELINRARLDPLAEAARYDVTLNDGLNPGTIDATAKQVLAPNAQLEQAAIDHSQWMLSTDTFSHTGVNSSSPGARMAAAGYSFTGSWTWRENLAWVGSTGTVNMAAAIEKHHEGLYRSSGHRANTFAENIREIGIGQVAGTFQLNGSNYNSSMLTEKFAASGAESFVTGVAYHDKDGDRFYSIGEGQKGVWFRYGSNTEKTATAGGYGLDVGTSATATVRVGIGTAEWARVKIDMDDGNAKLDFVTEASGAKILATSATTELVSGLARAKLLGSADLNLIGSQKSNQLYGNSGDNRFWGRDGNDAIYGASGDDLIWGGYHNDRLFGGNGKDRLFGDAGDDVLRAGRHNDLLYGGTGDDRLYGDDDNDRLYGGSGDDRLAGGAGRDWLVGGDGNDKMRGNGGADTFVFHGGRDMVQDFEDDIDTIMLSDTVPGLENATVADVLSMGVLQDDFAILTFDDGHRLVIKGVETLADLANDLIII